MKSFYRDFTVALVLSFIAIVLVTVSFVDFDGMSFDATWTNPYHTITSHQQLK